MGLIGAIFGNPGTVRAVGNAAAGVAEVFTENRTKAMEQAQALRMATMAEHGAEFAAGGEGWWNGFCNGLNRLPRPVLALATIALFGYAMSDPAGFTLRMQGLGFVPEPLWWLMGAIVSFYFGAREAHYFRSRRARDLPVPMALPLAMPVAVAAGPAVPGAAEQGLADPDLGQAGPAASDGPDADAEPAPGHALSSGPGAGRDGGVDPAQTLLRAPPPVVTRGREVPRRTGVDVDNPALDEWLAGGS